MCSESVAHVQGRCYVTARELIRVVRSLLALFTESVEINSINVTSTETITRHQIVSERKYRKTRESSDKIERKRMVDDTARDESKWKCWNVYRGNEKFLKYTPSGEVPPSVVSTGGVSWTERPVNSCSK